MEFKDILFLTSYVNNQTSYKYNLYTVGGLNNIAKKNYQTHTHELINLHISHFVLTLALWQDIISKNVTVMTPHNHPPIRGVIEVIFFQKMIRCGAREKTNIWRPWRQELRKRQRWIGILENWGCFLQNYELLLGQYSKIYNQWNFLEKDTNFCWIFYVM